MKNLTPTLSGLDIVYTVGMAQQVFYYVEGCKRSFDWASKKLSHVWVRLFLEKLKIVATKNRTHMDSKAV